MKINVNMPKTFFGHKPADLIDGGAGCVRARPFYQVPSSPGSTTSVESEFAYACSIIETFGDGYLLVKFLWEGAPGAWRQLFHPYELHRSDCLCRACKGDSLFLL